MPKLIIDIDDIYKTINRPVIMQVTKDVIGLSDFPADCDIYFKGFSKQTVNKESVMADKDKESITFSHSNRVIVSAEKKYFEPTVYAGQPFFKSFRPIFYNKEYNISLCPIHHMIEVNLTLNFLSKNRQIIEMWRSDIRRKIGMSVKGYPHGITYTYPINECFTKILHHLFEKKNIYAFEDMSFATWFENHSYEKITVLTNQIGDCPTLSVEQHQLGAYGVWDLTEVPEIEKLDTGDVYQASINYILRYSQPTSLSIEYPVILANSIVDNDYRPPCDFNEPLVLGDPEKLVWGLDRTRKPYPAFYPCEPLRLPCFDEWITTTVPKGVGQLYSALIVVDENDPTFVMNLIDLGSQYAIADWLIEAMRDYKNNMLVIGKCPILVLMYRNDSFFEANLLTIDENLNLYIKQPMGFTNQYHVTLNLFTDLSLLSEKAIETLRANKDFCTKLFNTIAPELIDESDAQRLDSNSDTGSIGKLEFWNTVSKMRNTFSMYKNSTERRRLTVGSCLIRTRRNNDATG